MSSTRPAPYVPEDLVAQAQSVLQGRSRNLIIRELQRTNLDVNLAVNNLLSRDEEDGDDGDEGQDNYVPEDLISLLDAGINADHPSVIIDADAMFSDDAMLATRKPGQLGPPALIVGQQKERGTLLRPRQQRPLPLLHLQQQLLRLRQRHLLQCQRENDNLNSTETLYFVGEKDNTLAQSGGLNQPLETLLAGPREKMMPMLKREKRLEGSVLYGLEMIWNFGLRNPEEKILSVLPRLLFFTVNLLLSLNVGTSISGGGVK